MKRGFGFVVDASVALAWLFRDEATAATDAVLERMSTETAVVPGQWFIELANAAFMAERKGRITPADTAAYCGLLSRFEIEGDGQAPGRAFSHILPLCRAQRLTSYDAVYVELALRRGLPLATLDAAMSTAARELGLKLLI